MNKININERTIKSIQVPKENYKIYWDQKIIGFGFRITANNSTSFILRYVINTKERKFTIGNYPSLSCIAAREKAIKLKGDIINGIDPLDIKSKERDTLTMGNFIKIYLEYFKSKARKKTIIFYEDIIKRYILINFENRKIDDIKYSDIEKIHLSMKDKKYMANRIIQIISSIFSYAIKKNLLKENPAKHIKKYKEDSRDRYLSRDEIERINNIFKTSSQKLNIYLIKLLLLTGSRKSELLSAQWNHFDLINNIWIKPASLTKQNKISCIPLNNQAVQILLDMKENVNKESNEEIISNEKYLFFNTKTQKPLADIKRFWTKICQAANIENCRIHDLRHTFASILINSGENLYQTGKLMGHSNSKTTERYSHLVNNTLKNAIEKVKF